MVGKNSIAGAIQMVSQPDVQRNLDNAYQLMVEATKSGAQWVVLPENFAHMGVREEDKLAIAETQGSGRIQDFLSKSARELNVWIVGGTLPLKASKNKVYASCLVYDNLGQMQGRYDKIHLFDVQVPESNESYMESATVESGNTPLVIDTPFGKLGVAICYDLRFPELFRLLEKKGAQIIALPSAFTELTGKAHWELLVRARAVENSCYLIAASQGGKHQNSRETFGDSMIVDPWGKVLARQAKGQGWLCAKLDLDKLENIRGSFPVLKHRKLS